jgi:galactonate dehydratase
VTAVVVNARLRNWLFVKVTTDVAGLIGWGEATLEWKTRAVAGAIEDLAPLLVGADPYRIEHLWQGQHRWQFFQGGVVTMSAISGIDQALWDIKAKALGVPVYELIGGATRDRVRMYDHLGGGDSAAVYGNASIDGFVEAAGESVRQGYTALKILAVPVAGHLVRHREVKIATDLMRAVRETVGDEVDIMVDLHGRATAAMAIQYGLALAPFRPWFLEEPCQPGNPAEMADVARALPIPIAAGERLLDIREFREHLAMRAMSVLQPDVCHVGGITAMKKIAAFAESHQVSIAPHNPLGPIATVVNQHIGFSTPNFLIQEVMRADVPWRDDVVSGQLPIVDGHVSLPTEPGLGVEVNEAEAKKHPYVPEPQLMQALADGSVADW